MKDFSINRVYLLMKKDVLENIKVISLGYLFTIGLVIFLLITDAHNNNSHLWKDFNQVYKMSIFFVGVLVAGMAFTNFRTKELTITFLTLPASAIEKTVSQIVLVILGTLISYTFVFFIAQFLFIAIGKTFYTIEIGFFNPFASENIESINYFIIIQSIFIAGASYFKKASLFKTGGAVFVLWMIIFGLFNYLIFSTIQNLPSNVGLITNFGISNAHININSPNIIDTSELWSGKVASVFFNYLFAPIFWLITYYNVKEKEV